MSSIDLTTHCAMCGAALRLMSRVWQQPAWQPEARDNYSDEEVWPDDTSALCKCAGRRVKRGEEE